MKRKPMLIVVMTLVLSCCCTMPDGTQRRGFPCEPVKLPWQTASKQPELVAGLPRGGAIWRGPRPDFDELKRRNIGVVLSLEDDNAENGLELKECMARGIAFVNMPMSETQAPTTEHLRKIAEMINQEGVNRVYVH